MATLPISRADPHDHVFLGAGHERNERRVCLVIALCGTMMLAEIIGGIQFGSIALVADGLHMSTHAGAMLLAALAYTFSRRRAGDTRFTFGTGKLGDLAGFTSAVVLAMIALLIGYEFVTRFMTLVPIHFSEALPIAALGLCVNLASARLLGAGSHHHGHHHENRHGGESHEKDSYQVSLGDRTMRLSIHEDDVPPRFRLISEDGLPVGCPITIETIRPDGTKQRFELLAREGYLESCEEIPEPHAFLARLTGQGHAQDVRFEEHAHHTGAHHRDNNMRAAVIHVMADAAVSVLVIAGLVLARVFGWLWMDPIAGLVGAVVIASWSYGLLRDTAAVLLDMVPDTATPDHIRRQIEAIGDDIVDLHVWRLGPGHLGAIVAVTTAASDRDASFYRACFAQISSLSHVTIEVHRLAA